MNVRSRSSKNYFTSLVVRVTMKILRGKKKKKLNVNKKNCSKKRIKMRKTIHKYQHKTKERKRKNVDQNTIFTCKMTPNQMVAAPNGIILVL